MKNLKVLIQDTKDVLDELNIEYGPILNVTINYTAKSRWGRCTRRYNGYEIEISSILLRDDIEWESAMNTMIHEFLHAHKNRMCHTGEWKRCANLVNREFPQYHISRTSSALAVGLSMQEIESSYKYVIVCDKCGAVNRYHRKSSVVSAILANPKNSGCRCKCGGTKFTVK